MPSSIERSAAAGVELEQNILAVQSFRPLTPPPRLTEARIFEDKPIGLCVLHVIPPKPQTRCIRRRFAAGPELIG
jgi:hypothetical protein